jgi:hypothetical protein
VPVGFNIILILVLFYFTCTDVYSCLWLQEDLRKIDNWQYINCLNLWVRFLCCNYKDCNFQSLFLQLQVKKSGSLIPWHRILTTEIEAHVDAE